MDILYALATKPYGEDELFEIDHFSSKFSNS